MHRLAPTFALFALLAATGCATAGAQPEPRFAGHHHYGRAASAVGLVGTLAELAASIVEIQSATEEDEARNANEANDGMQEQSVAWAEIPHQPPVVTPVDRPHTPFDAPAAREAIAAADVSSCIARGAPAGYVHARVTFASDGQVTGVGFDGGAMSAEAIACLDEQLKSVEAPPFEGAPITVGASVLLR